MSPNKRLYIPFGAALAVLLLSACKKEISEASLREQGDEPADAASEGYAGPNWRQVCLSDVTGEETCGVWVHREDGYLVLGGDMIIGLDEELEAPESADETGLNLRRGHVGFSITPWPGGQVNYAFDSSVSEGLKDTVLRAMRDWQATGNVSFQGYVNDAYFRNQAYSVLITVSKLEEGVVGRAEVGASRSGHLRLGSNQVPYQDVAHELGHVLGLAHEHQRSDAKEYIKILPENLREDAKDTFQTIRKEKDQSIPIGIARGDFDFNSIMLYGSIGGHSVGKKPAYVRRDNGKEVAWPKGISAGDAAAIRSIYGGSSRSSNSTSGNGSSSKGGGNGSSSSKQPALYCVTNRSERQCKDYSACRWDDKRKACYSAD